jgi:predicted transposase/invertase (TIGR01784 family)
VGYTPTNNLLFLKCFASPENSNVLCGFIRDVLGIPIKEATAENPYDIRTVQERLAHTTVDVLARLKDGSLVSVEMQIQPQKHFAKRTLYYAASRYVSGYGDERRIPGHSASDALYASLRPIFGINVCDFNLFDDYTDPLRTFELFDTTYHTKFAEPLLHISFLQLKKEALAGQERLAYWLSFFKGCPPAVDVPEYLKQAYQTVAYVNLTEKEREMIDYAEMSREDAKAQLEYARDEGIEQGIARGRVQGIEQGTLQTASRMLTRGMALRDVLDITGLDAETIKRLQEN